MKQIHQSPHSLVRPCPSYKIFLLYWVVHIPSTVHDSLTTRGRTGEYRDIRWEKRVVHFRHSVLDLVDVADDVHRASDKALGVDTNPGIQATDHPSQEMTQDLGDRRR